MLPRWVPALDGAVLPDAQQPRLRHNQSGRFESRWSMLRVQTDNKSVLLKGMEGSLLGVWVAHGEGQVRAGTCRMCSCSVASVLIEAHRPDDYCAEHQPATTQILAV